MYTAKLKLYTQKVNQNIIVQLCIELNCVPVAVEMIVGAAGDGEGVVAGVGVVHFAAAAAVGLHDLLARRLPLFQHLPGGEDGALAALDDLVEPHLQVESLKGAELLTVV